MSLRSRRNVEVAAPGAVDPEPAEDAPVTSGWKAEIEAITNGTHPALVAELSSHEKLMQQLIGQAERMKNAQAGNIHALFDCDKKQVEDEYKAQIEFFQNRLIDSLEQKQRKMARLAGFRIGRRPSESGKSSILGDAKRKKSSTGEGLEYALKNDECKADIEEILRNVDHYTVRNAALAGGGGDDSRHSSGANEVWYDRNRAALICHGHTFERNGSVVVLHNGQRVDDEWHITAMNAVEATLKSADGAKLKVTLSQLRNGKYALRQTGS